MEDWAASGGRESWTETETERRKDLIETEGRGD